MLPNINVLGKDSNPGIPDKNYHFPPGLNSNPGIFGIGTLSYLQNRSYEPEEEGLYSILNHNNNMRKFEEIDRVMSHEGERVDEALTTSMIDSSVLTGLSAPLTLQEKFEPQIRLSLTAIPDTKKSSLFSSIFGGSEFTFLKVESF